MGGTVTLRDADRRALPDLQGATRAAMIGGVTPGDGQMTGVAGGALLIRCVDLLSAPTLEIHAYDATPAVTNCGTLPPPEGWTWLTPATIILSSGVLTLGTADDDIAVGRPGRYRIVVGHLGRPAFLVAAERVRGDTHVTPAATREQAWDELRSLERYAIHLWPVD